MGDDNNDEARGKLDNLKGRVKQAAGSITGNKKLEAEGAAERVKGAAQEKVGTAKRKLDDAAADEEEEAEAEAARDDDKI
jgi:uncharacterized protein YjbJ (UPF0337 family)